ncbi:hypothetical protein [Burkholderia sp. Ac-20365]|uniref:hypothetical protein n=1 Tax=Burkholderia sp. Ac-20365 TaxID=2703897 RepID=UPI00197C6228|nr:hypothetical protein [Burkholderia sp. Ac-20365]MBN3761227.1 hypothetical protein [Burkholderia sp. Ac-20365]
MTKDQSETPIDTYRRIARERGGVCLSDEYRGSKVSLRFRCSEGHEWEARPADIKNKPTNAGRGTWCALCSKRRIAGIATFHEMAAARGGVCLSTEYKNVETRLAFRCAQGHEWEARAENVRLGHWCRRCAVAESAKARRPPDDRFEALAARHGGVCLSTYVDALTPLHFRCAHGHEWRALPKSANQWCRTCTREQRRQRAFEAILQLVQSRGGICLSTSYETQESTLRLRCANGHEWEAKAGAIHRGSWCIRCVYARNGDAARATLDEFQAIAARHGGTCLSTHYEHSTSKLHFRCASGHEWSRTPVETKKRDQLGYFCSYCKGTLVHDLFGKVVTIARERGYECLSSAHGRSDRKLRFRCDRGHEWSTSGHAVLNGYGLCRVCANLTRFERVLEVARANGGECLSGFEEYRSATLPLRFRCVDGHEWQSSANQVTSGYWCRECTHKTEGLVRQLLECVFDVRLPSLAPEWLSSDAFSRCILDGYNEDRRLAFEYHGEQHFAHVGHFHGRDGARTFSEQQARDEHVRTKCAEQNVTLIEIPAIPQRRSAEELVAAVAVAVERATGVVITQTMIDSFTARPFQRGKLRELAELAESRGGQCLSVKFEGVNTPVSWLCREGHRWEATPSSVTRGAWCAVCARVRIAAPMDEMHALAAARGGRCLATEYHGSGTKHPFECDKGHQFEMRPAFIKLGHWCERCSYTQRGLAQRLPIDEVRAIAVAKGGALLSDAYSSGKRTLRFRCAIGHEWEALPTSVKHQSWCPRCASTLRGKKSVEARRRRKNALVNEGNE